MIYMKGFDQDSPMLQSTQLEIQSNICFKKFQKHIQSIEIMLHSLMFFQSALMLILTFYL